MDDKAMVRRAAAAAASRARFRARLRRLVADYICSEGCSCCEFDTHPAHREALAKALDVPQYDDKSGYDWYSCRGKSKKRVR